MDIEVTSESFPGEHVVEIAVSSAALAGSAAVRLLTPPGWKPDTKSHWPTLYLLHGGDDGPHCWTERTDIAARARDAGVLVVLPDGGRAGFYTAWRHPIGPSWPTFHLRELRELLESRYGAGPRRAIAGVSMGGYGAVMYAMRHPGMFAAVASYSGMLHTTRWGMPLLLRYFLHSVGERVDRMWGPRWRNAAHWRANNPFDQAGRLVGTPVYVAAGDGTRVPGDEPAPGDRLLERLTGPTSRAFAARLAALGGDVRTSFGPGTHAWPSWQRELDRSWPFLRAALTEGNNSAGRRNLEPLHPEVGDK